MYYFRINGPAAGPPTFTSNGSALTESDHYRLLTVAEQETAKLMEVMGTARSGTAGGGSLRGRRYGTPSSSGTSVTPAPVNPGTGINSVVIAAGTTAFTAPTAGSTATNLLSIGLAQTGGQGGWVTPFDGAGIDLMPNGGANGNFDILSIFNAASVTFDCSLGFREGS
jgi:hypothetical protein